MKNLVRLAVATVVVTTLLVPELAHARGRRCGCSSSNVVSVAAPALGTSVVAAPSPAAPQVAANPAGGYRSFSYDPSSADAGQSTSAPVYSAPVYSAPVYGNAYSAANNRNSDYNRFNNAAAKVLGQK